jgi:hypothetical protein
MTERVDHRIFIKFCFKLGHLTVETIHMIKKAFRDDLVGEIQIKFWCRRFKHGQESVVTDPCSVRPATSGTPKNVEHVCAVINENRRLTVRELEEDLGIPQAIVSEILTEDLGKKYLAANLFHGSYHKSRRNRAEVAEDMLETANNDPDFLKKVMTRDEVMGLWL